MDGPDENEAWLLLNNHRNLACGGTFINGGGREEISRVGWHAGSMMVLQQDETF
jgi:hypothetical protein